MRRNDCGIKEADYVWQEKSFILHLFRILLLLFVFIILFHQEPFVSRACFFLELKLCIPLDFHHMFLLQVVLCIEKCSVNKVIILIIK